MKRAAALGLLVAASAIADERVAPLDPPPARVLRSLAHDPLGYDPSRHRAPTDTLLGDLLYHSPRVLGPEAERLGLSCQTCHPNGATHRTLAIDGLSDRPGNVDLSTARFRAGADDGIADALNVPSLRGVRYTGPYGRDGRTASLAEFTQGVVTGEFAGAPLSPSRLGALVRYEQELDFVPNSLLDESGRLSARAGAAARRGEALFHRAQAGFGGASCATCHPPSSYFRDGQVHRLGTGKPAAPAALDDGYETPTLLGTVESAPYFHDGRFATLAEVVAWLDERFHLALGPSGRADLVAYLAAVGAVDSARDERSIGQRVAENAAYLALLTDGAVAEDREIWSLAIDAVIGELRALPGPVGNALTERREALLTTLSTIGKRAASGDSLAPLRDELRRLQIAIPRLGADWTAAVPAGAARR